MGTMTKLSRLTRMRSFGRDKDGISAVEFALIAPLMALLYFGCIELSFMMQADRKVTSSASTLGDLVARAAVINDTEMNDIFAATDMIFQPVPSANVKLRVSSLIDKDGAVEVDWSSSKNISPLSEGSTVTVPANLVPPGGSVVMAEVQYEYTSDLGFFLKNSRDLKDTFYLRPRRVNFVERVPD